MRVTLSLASLAMAALACTAARTNPAEGLVGMELAVLRERLGPPVEFRVGSGTMQLGYATASGEVFEDAVLVIGDKVVQARDDLVPNPAAGLADELTLMPVQHAVERLGPIRRVLHGRLSTKLCFDGWTATVVDDLVIGLAKS